MAGKPPMHINLARSIEIEGPETEAEAFLVFPGHPSPTPPETVTVAPCFIEATSLYSDFSHFGKSAKEEGGMRIVFGRGGAKEGENSSAEKKRGGEAKSESLSKCLGAWPLPPAGPTLDISDEGAKKADESTGKATNVPLKKRTPGANALEVPVGEAGEEDAQSEDDELVGRSLESKGNCADGCECRPCANFYSKGGCPDGEECSFCHTHATRKRTRPCKGKRVRLLKIITALEAQVKADPIGFDLDSVFLPRSLFKDEVMRERLSGRLDKKRAEVLRSLSKSDGEVGSMPGETLSIDGEGDAEKKNKDDDDEVLTQSTHDDSQEVLSV